MTKPKDRWNKFCIEYVKDFDRVRAYKAAGFKVKSDNVARANVNRLMLSNVIVQDKIKDLLEKQKERAEKTADNIIEELEKIGFGKKTKDVNKIKALELLGRRFGLFPNKQVHDATDSFIAALSKAKNDSD